jgi:hypothetical protein
MKLRNEPYAPKLEREERRENVTKDYSKLVIPRYNYILENVKLETSFVRPRYFEAVFIRNFYKGFVTCPLIF